MRVQACSLLMTITIASLFSCDLQRRAKLPDTLDRTVADDDTYDMDRLSVKDEPSRLVVQNGHNGVVNILTWSPDGRILATGSYDNTVRLWDKHGMLINTMKHNSDVKTIAFSPDCTMLASGNGSGDFEDSDNTIRLWDNRGKLIKTLVGHKNDVNTVAFSPDGNELASGSTDNTVRLWDVKGNLIKVMVEHTGGVEALAFNPDGHTLASASRDTTVRLWDRKGNLIKTLEGHTGSVWTLAFSPDGITMASGSDDKTVRLWDRKGNLIKSLEGHSKGVQTLAFSPDGTTLASGSWDGTVRLWDRKGNLIKNIKSDMSAVKALAFSPDGGTLASGSYDDNPLHLWDKQGNLLKRLMGPMEMENETVYTLAFSPDGSILASGSEDRVIRLWDREGNLINTMTGRTRYIHNLNLSPDGSMLSVESTGDKIHFWDTKGQPIKTMEMDNCGYTFSPDGAILVYGSDENTIRFRDKEGNLIQTLEGHAKRVTTVAFSPDGRTLASGSEDKTIRLWDIKGSLIKTLEGNTGSVKTIAFSPDGNMLAAVCVDDTIRVWDKRGILITTLNIPDDGVARDDAYLLRRTFKNLAFSPDSTMLAYSSGNNLVSVWYKNGNHAKTLEGHKFRVAALAFSPDGNTLASGSFDKTIRLWDRTGNLIKTLEGHTDIIYTIAFSPDGSTLASGADDGTIRLWDNKGNHLKTIEGYIVFVDSLGFSPDGNTLLSAGDGSVKLWDPKTGALRCTLMAFNTGDWFSITDDGYWDGSRDGGKYVAMVKGMETFGVDQFAIRNNRPDIILGRLGSTDTDAIAAYKKQYDKRILKLRKIYNIDETALSGEYHVPVAKVRDTGERRSGEKHITITADLQDARYSLVAYNIYVNDVPLYKGFGPKIDGHSKTITERIELTEGDNKIEVSCLNEKGAESYRGRAFANYQPAKEQAAKPKLYYIGFGVSRYALPKKIRSLDFKRYVRRSPELKKSERAEVEALYTEQDAYFIMKGVFTKAQEERMRVLLDKADLSLDLRYAHRDVLDLAETFKKMEGKEYSEVVVKPYINEQVTPDAIRNAKVILKNATVDDTFVLFISGHGMHDTDKETTYYYITSNADPDNLAGTAAPFETVEDLMQDIRPRKKLFFMDTCESGELDDTKLNSVIVATRGSKGVRARSVRKRSVNQAGTGPAPKRAFLLEKERYIYNDLFRRSGAIVFSSCQGNEVSYEHDDLKNGFFTAAIKRAIREGKADVNKDNAISSDELRDFVAKEVPEICRELKINENAIQHPTVDRDNLFMKIKFPALR